MTSLESWKIVRDRSRCERPGCPLATAAEFFALLELPDCLRRDLCATCFEQLPAGERARSVFWKARRREGGKKEPMLDLQSLRLLFERLGEIGAESGPAALDAEDLDAEDLGVSGLDVEEVAAADVDTGEGAADGREAAEESGGDGAAEDEDPVARSARARELRYFVALLLLRKRQLRMVDPKTEEQERADLVVIDPKAEGAEPVALFAPELDTDRMANLKNELLAALDED